MRACLLGLPLVLTGCSGLIDKVVSEVMDELIGDEEEEAQIEEGDQQGDCFDGEDNDDDGNIDCADSGCSGKPACEADTGLLPNDTGEPVEDTDTQDTDTQDTDTQDTDTQDTDTQDTDSQDADTQDSGGGVDTQDDDSNPEDSGTGETTDPETTVSDIVGNTYVIDLNTALILQPALLGSIFTNDRVLLMGIVSDSNGQLEARGALSEVSGTTQDMCIETEENFSLGDFSASPSFVFPPFDATVLYGGLPLVLKSVELSGTFAIDGSSFEDGVITGEMDTRDNIAVFGPAVGGIESPEDVCALVAGFGTSCIPCDSDGQSLCMDVEVVNISAPRQSGALLSVAAADIANNSSCSN